MPWSISASQILTAAWLLALVPDAGRGRDAPRTAQRRWRAAGAALAAGACSACCGRTSPWSERYAGLEGFHKLLVIPLLLAQFRRSERGIYVVYGFLASCTAMLLASCGLMVLWKCCSVYVPGKIPGILVKDYIAQSSEFLVCVFGLLGFAAQRWQKGDRRFALRRAAARLSVPRKHFLRRARAHRARDHAGAAGDLRLLLFRLEGCRRCRGCRGGDRSGCLGGIAVAARARAGELLGGAGLRDAGHCLVVSDPA